MAKPMKQLPIVPAQRTLKVISGRWKVSILYHLFEGSKRLSELKRLAPTISQKVLIEQLREMEEHGIVHREVFRQVPARVDYTVTELGLSLKPVILTLCEWGKRHADELSAPAGAEARSHPKEELKAAANEPGCDTAVLIL